MISKKSFIKILIVSITFLANNLYSQNDINLLLLQDVRLAIAGDKTGNYKPFTLDFLAKLKLAGYQKESGYLVVSPFFEYAELEGVYKRYGFDIGFTYNNSIINGFSFTPSLNYGIQDRWGKSFLVLGTDFEISYRITQNIKIVALAQFVQRKDLKYRYNTNEIKFSGFAGISYRIN